MFRSWIISINEQYLDIELWVVKKEVHFPNEIKCIFVMAYIILIEFHAEKIEDVMSAPQKDASVWVNVKSKSIEQSERMTLIYNDIYIMFRLYVMFAPQDPSQDEYDYVSRLFLSQFSITSYLDVSKHYYRISFPSSITRTLYKTCDGLSQNQLYI